MIRLLRSAFVIARRDYTATVFSRTFLLFLIGPLLPALFGVGISAINISDDLPQRPAPIVAVAPAREGAALLAAHARVASYIARGRMPALRIVPPPANPIALLDAPDRPGAVLTGDFAHPVLTGPDAQALAGRVASMVDQAQQILLLDQSMPKRVWVTVRTPPHAGAPRPNAQRGFARGAQLGLFMLIVILTGMLISNLVEEKSNKVIEVLAAAVPVDAIFAGKLVGMLAVSLTGIAAWATMAAVAAASFLHPGTIPPPAVGWPAFVALCALYFSTLYLLVGAVFLGIGAQAGSVREVQTLSMPLTMGQLLLYGLASAGLAHPDGAAGLFGAILPWSSPYIMLARAAEFTELWPHPIALVWQIACLVLVIRIAGALFRRNVLKSGGLRFRRA